MSSSSPCRVFASLLICVLCLFFPSSAAVAKESSRVLPKTASTSPFRTINYITQTLPQQCLRTSWASDATVHGGKVSSLLLSEVPKIGSITPKTSNLSNTVNLETATEELHHSLPTDLTSHPPAQAASIPTSPPEVPDEPSHQPLETTTEVESDPLSDNANFLSFEEWKSRMLEKAGQSLEHVSSKRAGAEPRRRPGSINDALDSLGEDTEIKLDFSGFVNTDVASDTLPQRRRDVATTSEGKADDRESGTRGTKLSKDAGKTCKERSNYASFDCAATVLKTNSECKGSTSVLVENKDSYMLNECSAKNKFFIVELCNDILIDTIVLGNFEFFSSTFRTFRVSVSDRYPVKIDKWKELGTFEARNSREVQAFLVENPLIWARYLRVEFLTHYGNEFYCPISLLRVHGKTMMDDYRNEVKAGRGDEELDDDVAENNSELPRSHPDEDSSGVSMKNVTNAEAERLQEDLISDNMSATSNGTKLAATGTAVNSSSLPHPLAQSSRLLPWVTPYGRLLEQSSLVCLSCTAGKDFCDFEDVPIIRTSERVQHKKVMETHVTSAPNSLPTAVTSTDNSSSSYWSSSTSSPVNEAAEANISIIESPGHISSGTQSSSFSSPTVSPTKLLANSTSHSNSKVQNHPPAASPTTQESFFKSVHKRLQLLEANSTLSLQYIEEQSRILREAFNKVEKRQLSKTTAFLESLNSTVLSELREFRLQYDQIWQSTVLELSSQREQSQHEVIALSARLSILADEILFQKRMVIFQFVLILVCLGMVIFSSRLTSAGASYLELPAAVHNMVTRQSTSFSRYLHLDSPPGTPSRPGSRYGIFSRPVNHASSSPNGPTYEGISSKSLDMEYRPPTPVSVSSEDEQAITQVVAPTQIESVRAVLRRVKSSPAIAREQEIVSGSIEPKEFVPAESMR